MNEKVDLLLNQGYFQGPTIMGPSYGKFSHTIPISLGILMGEQNFQEIFVQFRGSKTKIHTSHHR